MKKSIFLAMLSAIVLTGTMTFTACSSEDAVEPNPTYDGESVKTTFTISVGDVKAPTTRMITDAVQKDEKFKGMTDIYLFPFKSAVTTANATSTTITESYIHLADFSDFDDDVYTAQGKIYKDVNLSVGVSNFLFYGAITSSTQGNGELKPSYLELTNTTDWADGYTKWAPSPVLKGSTKVSDITFDLVPIKRGWTLDMVKADAKATATIKPLNDADAALTTAIGQITGATTAEAAAKSELEEIQKTLRNELTTGNYTAYAGSSNSIKSLMEMLYATLKNLAGSTLSNGTGSYASGVISKIEESFTASENATTGEWTLEWITDPGFPANLGVPDGAAAVQYKGTSFEYVTTSVDGLEVPKITNYTYPARLYYTVNTPAMVRDAEYLSGLGDAKTTWDAIKTDGAYTEKAVQASSRSVIMKDQVQYAVGRLDVAVRVMPETIIEDNSKSVSSTGTITDAPQPVTVPSGGYKLTGVLIGGQRQVGWDFTPISTAEEMTIWDNVMSGTRDIMAIQQTDYSSINSTLALETAEDTQINIALEFENTGNDFCGIDHNLIPAGTKFYLVANLKPQKLAEGGNWTATGETGLNQVFKQDYITTALLTINKNSLKSAYNVVPDLRSPKLEFGLSVDLKWREGLTFEIDF